MNPAEFARATVPAVVDLPAKFMIDGQTYVRGGGLGFEGMDFYVAGRGGALGEVDADVVSAAFFFFDPASVREAWERSAPVLARRQSAMEFAGCAHAWADANLSDGIDHTRLAALLGTVVAAASPAGAPLFAGWRSLPEPSSAKALVLHRLNVLRELRGAYHEVAVMAAGLSPRDAVAVKTPFLLPLYGWPAAEGGETLPAGTWAQADATTDRLFGSVLAVLDEPQRDELHRLLVDVAGV